MAQNLDIPDAGGASRPSSELEIYDRAIRSTVKDEFLKDTNLGLGNYSNREMWQQIESFKKGLYGDGAFGRLLLARAIAQTKHALAVEAWEALDDEERDEHDRRRFVETRMDELWDAFGTPDHADQLDPQELRQVELERKWSRIMDETGFGDDWVPPHWRMMMARHEASRSRGARLLDNLFGRVREYKGNDSEESSRRFFGGGGEGR